MKALSIRQPFAWAIFVRGVPPAGGKNIENRTWPTKFRGEFLVHVPQKVDYSAWSFVQSDMGMPLPPLSEMNKEKTEYNSGWCTGGIIGIAEIVDCVTESDSPWFTGPYGFVIQNPRRIPFVPLKGKLRFFDVDLNIK